MQRAGIALSRLAYDADFVITRIDEQVDDDDDPTFSPPAHHKLVDGHTVDEIINIFHDTVGFDDRLERNGFQVSLPISASPEQWKAFAHANYNCLCDHLDAWITLHMRKNPHCNGYVNILFVDLTPGQISSQGVTAVLHPHGLRWHWYGINYKNILDRDFKSLNIDDVYDRLVRPIIMLSTTKLEYIVILRPEGAFSNISAADLESKLPNVCIEWITLDDISRGAALFMDLMQIMGDEQDTCLPIEIALANGKSVIVVLDHIQNPRGSFFFTTSQDNQTTATVQVSRDTHPWASLTLEGMIPRPRGEALLKVTFRVDGYDAIIVVEEIETGLKSSEFRGDTISPPKLNTYEESIGNRVEMVFGKDGIIGELPE
jgi:hypothetical protein